MSNEKGIKPQILMAIERTGDQSMKTILLLLLQVLEEIGGKIDAVLTDEKKLRDAVLNGHAKEHDSDHDWIRQKRKDEYDDKKADAESKRQIRNGLIEKVLWVILVICAAAGGWVIK